MSPICPVCPFANTSVKVTDLVRVSCEDGRDFIRTSVSRLYGTPFPAYAGPRPSRAQQEKERKQLQKRAAAEGMPMPPPVPADDTKPPRRRISHFVMNLPDSAITFLDAFRGILTDAEDRNLSGTYTEMPMIHCHCFTRELEPEKAEADIRQVGPYSVRIRGMIANPMICSGSKKSWGTPLVRRRAFTWCALWHLRKKCTVSVLDYHEK